MRLLHIILFLLIGTTAYPQTGEIYGIVFNENNKPFIGVAVQIFHAEDAKAIALSDSSGRYSFKSLDTGRYKILVNHSGYRKVTIQHIKIATAHIEQNIRLLPADPTINDVVITWKRPLRQTGEIYGTVLDEKNQPLAGTIVQVFYKDILKGEDITDTAGHFLITPLRVAKYTLVYKNARHAKVTTDEILVADYTRTIQNVKMIPLTDQVTDVFINHNSGIYKAYGPIFEFHYLDAINTTALPQTPETTRPSYIHWSLIDIMSNQLWHDTRNNLQWQSKK